mgnify:CR=1 FL=1
MKIITVKKVQMLIFVAIVYVKYLKKNKYLYYVYLMIKIHAFLSFLNDHFNIIILLFYCHCSFGITFHILCFPSVKIRLYSLLLKYSFAIFIFAINPQYFIYSEYFMNSTEANIILLQLRGYRAGV